MKTIRVKRIVDGDTFICEDETHYRLMSVDAPEAGRPGDYEATRALEKLIENKELEVIREQVDESYGRPVVEIRLVGDDESVNEKMKRVIKEF